MLLVRFFPKCESGSLTVFRKWEFSPLSKSIHIHIYHFPDTAVAVSCHWQRTRLLPEALPLGPVRTQALREVLQMQKEFGIQGEPDCRLIIYRVFCIPEFLLEHRLGRHLRKGEQWCLGNTGKYGPGSPVKNILLSSLVQAASLVPDIPMRSERQYPDAVLVSKETALTLPRSPRGPGRWFEFVPNGNCENRKGEHCSYALDGEKRKKFMSKRQKKAFPAFASPPDITTVFHRNLSLKLYSFLSSTQTFRCAWAFPTPVSCSVSHRSLAQVSTAILLIREPSAVSIFPLFTQNCSKHLSPSSLFDHPHTSVVLSVPLPPVWLPSLKKLSWNNSMHQRDETILFNLYFYVFGFFKNRHVFPTRLRTFWFFKLPMEFCLVRCKMNRGNRKMW